MKKVKPVNGELSQKHIIFVTDVDGTLTHKGNALFRLVDDHTLPDEGVAAMNALRERHMLAAQGRLLTEEEHRGWIIDSINSLKKHRVTKSAISEALKKAQIREGVRESLHELHASGIKIAAISFGVRQFIEIVFENAGILNYFDAIYAADLHFNDDGRVVGYDHRSIVTPETKGHWSKVFAAKHHFNESIHERIIALGDTKGDMHLGHHKEHRLGIAKDHEEAKFIAEHFAEVKVDPHFSEVHSWLVEKVAKLR